MIGNIARVRGSACTIIFTEKCVKGKRCPYSVDRGYTVNECSGDFSAATEGIARSFR